MTDNTHQVRERAYRIWEEQGRPEGRETDHWFEAERQLHEGQGAESANEGKGSQTGAREDNRDTTQTAQSGRVKSTA
jgi:hypothetical protein